MIFKRYNAWNLIWTYLSLFSLLFSIFVIFTNQWQIVTSILLWKGHWRFIGDSNPVPQKTKEGSHIQYPLSYDSPPVVNAIKLFWGNLDFPKIKKLNFFVLISEPALKCENNAIFKQNYTLKQIIAFEMVYSCCFGLRGNLEFQISSKKVIKHQL